MLESVKILKTKMVRERNTIKNLNCAKTQTEKKLIGFSCYQTSKKIFVTKLLFFVVAKLTLLRNLKFSNCDKIKEDSKPKKLKKLRTEKKLHFLIWTQLIDLNCDKTPKKYVNKI